MSPVSPDHRCMHMYLLTSLTLRWVSLHCRIGDDSFGRVDAVWPKEWAIHAASTPRGYLAPVRPNSLYFGKRKTTLVCTRLDVCILCDHRRKFVGYWRTHQKIACKESLRQKTNESGYSGARWSSWTSRVLERVLGAREKHGRIRQKESAQKTF